DAAFAAGVDQSVEAQPGQLLRHCGLRHVHDVLEFGDGFLPFRQKTENEKSAFMRQRLEQVAGLARLLKEQFEVFWRLAGFEFGKAHSFSGPSSLVMSSSRRYQKNSSPG